MTKTEGGRHRAPFLIERKVLDKYEGEARKNKGKIQEKVSQMKIQGGTYLCEMRGVKG